MSLRGGGGRGRDWRDGRGAEEKLVGREEKGASDVVEVGEGVCRTARGSQ